MLPPDTSSTLFPWRVVVPTMQVYGCFPYTVSATSDQPAFSLPLGLWSIFAFLLQIAMICTSYEGIIPHNLSLEVGAIVYTSIILLTAGVMCSIPVAVGVRSGRLANLLHDLSKIKEVSPPPTYRWYCRPLTQAAILAGITLTVSSVYIGAQLCCTSIMDTIILSPAVLLYVIGFMLPEQVSFMVFSLLGRRLVAATEATVATVSMLLGPHGSFKCDTDAEAAMLALCDLDAVIREV